MATADIVRRHYGRYVDTTADWTQLHCRSQCATLELAALAQLRPGLRVLDVGSGLGGPARDLATRFGVRVTGLELTTDFVDRARDCTARAGLSDSVSFTRGNILSAPFPSGAFDVVWLQHVLPNIADKARGFAEVRRLLARGGRLALHEVVAFDAHRLHFPLPWATTPTASFVARPERLQQALGAAGFNVAVWKDTSVAALQWCREVTESGVATSTGATVRLGKDALQALTNVARNLQEGRLGIVMAVFDHCPARPRPQRAVHGRVLPFSAPSDRNMPRRASAATSARSRHR